MWTGQISNVEWKALEEVYRAQIQNERRTCCQLRNDNRQLDKSKQVLYHLPPKWSGGVIAEFSELLVQLTQPLIHEIAIEE